MVPMGEDGNAQACAFMEIAGSGNGEFYGVGIDGNIVTASLKALVSGINRMGIARPLSSRLPRQGALLGEHELHLEADLPV